ncbi:rRNA-processing protein utp23 [Dictyocoela muelleri]|nr:rRNA-processing protein utp23 [Dictyocoela muelleri]
MRSKTTKNTKKILKKLESEYKFRKPYQILIDKEFLQQIDHQKKTLSNFEKFFFSMPKFFIPECDYQKGEFSKHIELRGCKNHNSPVECLKYILKGKNKEHYILGVRNKEAISYVKECKNVPILKIVKSKIILDINHFKVVEKGKVEIS